MSGLILGRYIGEKFSIIDGKEEIAEIEILGNSKGQIRIRINASDELCILREELINDDVDRLVRPVLT